MGSTPTLGTLKMNSNLLFPWTSKLAYGIGLLTTDGNLSPDKRHISLTSSDLQLLQTFRECFNLSNKITPNPKGSYSKKLSYRIQFGNVLLYRWLNRIGLMPKKTSRLSKIKIPDKFMRDFLRGHLDGDGSIIVYEDRYNTFKNPRYIYERLYTNFISSSPKHLNWISSKLKTILDIKGAMSSYKKTGCNKNAKAIWKLRFAKHESLKLLSWLYYKPNLPCLIRKRNIALRILQENNIKNS